MHLKVIPYEELTTLIEADELYSHPGLFGKDSLLAMDRVSFDRSNLRSRVKRMEGGLAFCVVCGRVLWPSPWQPCHYIFNYMPCRSGIRQCFIL
jgi:hypothetical protein